MLQPFFGSNSPANSSAQPRLFRSVQRPDGGPFWARNGLLFASIEDVKKTTAQLTDDDIISLAAYVASLPR